jgi:hypothetical protein
METVSALKGDVPGGSVKRTWQCKSRCVVLGTAARARLVSKFVSRRGDTAVKENVMTSMSAAAFGTVLSSIIFVVRRYQRSADDEFQSRRQRLGRNSPP